MKLVQVLLLTLSITNLNAQSCEYTMNEWPGYTCYLSINNPSGSNSFTSIGGSHMSRQSNSNVKQVKNRGDSSTKNFPSAICSNFRNTEKIEFKSAGIEVIDEGSFKDCQALTQLDLGMNRISQISESAFSNNLLLSGLVLTGNLITSLPENLLANNQNIQALLLSNNPFESIPDGFFRATRNIQALFISNTNLNRISPVWFDNFQQIQSVYMENNLIDDIPDGAFKNLKNMQYMNLQGNKIRVIRAASFAPQSNWQYLDLSNNQIEAVERRFAELVNVQVIQMMGNVCVRKSVVNVFKFNDLAMCFRNFEG